MFISVLELFKIGIGPSSSHTLGPMVAANDFVARLQRRGDRVSGGKAVSVRCTLKGSLAYTGKGHATDQAITLGLHGYTPEALVDRSVSALVENLWQQDQITLDDGTALRFTPADDIVFDTGEPLPQHPNGMIFELVEADGTVAERETYFSIGGGFISTLQEISTLEAPLKMGSSPSCPYPFESAQAMLEMAGQHSLTIAEMKRENEREHHSAQALREGMAAIWASMQRCIRNGLQAEGVLPGGLEISRRAKQLHQSIEENTQGVSINEWLCAYAMAVNEENAAGHLVVTAPTNGAAGVIPAVLYYLVTHEQGSATQVETFLLTASAIGGLIKHRSSISGAEVGCQGEVGSAAAMAAAGLCAAKGGTPQQIENAAEIALEHHLGMTCDPVQGLVQVPCIERNGFGAIKAYTAATLALRGDGSHFMPLDSCIEAMKRTGQEMSTKYKETSLGGLAVSITEC